MVLVLAVGLLTAAAVAWLLYQLRPGRTAIPGVSGPNPLLNVVKLTLGKQDGLKFLGGMLRKYGNVFCFSVGFKVIVTLEPEDVEHVLSSNFDNFKRMQKMPWRLEKFFGKGIFAANDRNWSVQRNAARPYFTVQAIADYVPIFCSKSAELGDQLAMQAGKTIDVQDLFMRFTLDSFGLMGFGFDFDSIKQRPQFPDWFDYLQMRTELTLRNPVARHLPDAEFSSQLAQIDKVMYGLIAKRKTEKFREKNDLLSRFMCLVDEKTGQPYDDEWLRDVLFNLLIAGRDTTAITLTWFFYLVSTYPEVEERLLEEIGTLPADEPLTLQSIKQLRYLDRCISEVLRLYPAVPSEGRFSVKDCTLPSGHFCPANTLVTVSAYFMQRRADLFPNPLQFDPDRWHAQPPHAFAYIPFYGGPQVCLGQSLALVEAKVAIVSLMRRFSFRLADGFTPTPVKLIVLRAQGGMKMQATPR